MTWCDSERPLFYSERLVRARKPHRCCETDRVMPPGEPHWYIAVKWDGDFRIYRQSQAAFHFARWLNGFGPDGVSRSYEECIPFRGIAEHVAEMNYPKLAAEWRRVCAGEITRSTMPAAAVGGGA